MTFRVIVMMTKENIFLNKAHIGIINLYLFLQTYKKLNTIVCSLIMNMMRDLSPSYEAHSSS